MAEKIRQALLKLDWHFEDDMKDYSTPNILSTFLKWVLTGPHPISDEKDRYRKADILVSKISQLVIQNVKTDKQMRTLKTSENIRGYSTIQTLLSIRIGFSLYQHTRSKKLINFLSDLNISANYKKVIHLKKDIVNSIEMRRQDNNGVFIPPGFQKKSQTFFAIDNIDLKVDTPDGKSQLHGTAIAAYQQQIGNSDTNMVR